MSERTVCLEPFGWQYEALDSIENNTTTLCCCGRGAGKTLLSQMAMIREAFRAPNRKIIYACQSHKLVKEVYNDLLQSPGFESLLHPLRGYAEQPTPHFRFANNSRLTMLSLANSAGKSLGLECHFLVLDECRELSEQVFNDLSPMVSRLRGKTLLCSTLKHRQHWFTRLFELGQTQNTIGLKSFKVPSSMGICYQGEEGALELEKEKATRPEHIFNRDFLCDLSNNEKCVFKPDLIESCVRKDLKPVAASKDDTLLLWDLGRKADPSAVIIGSPDGRLLHAQLLKIGVDWDKQVTDILALANRYNSTVVIESNGTINDALCALIRPRLLPHIVKDVPIRNTNKENLMNNLVFRMEKKSLFIPDHDMFRPVREQLEALEYKETASYVGYESDIHDDYVSCLMLFVEGINRSFIGPVVSSWSDDRRPVKFL